MGTKTRNTAVAIIMIGNINQTYSTIRTLQLYNIKFFDIHVETRVHVYLKLNDMLNLAIL